MAYHNFNSMRLQRALILPRDAKLAHTNPLTKLIRKFSLCNCTTKSLSILWPCPLQSCSHFKAAHFHTQWVEDRGYYWSLSFLTSDTSYVTPEDDSGRAGPLPLGPAKEVTWHHSPVSPATSRAARIKRWHQRKSCYCSRAAGLHVASQDSWGSGRRKSKFWEMAVSLSAK